MPSGCFDFMRVGSQVSRPLGHLVFTSRPPGQDLAVAFNFATITKELEDQRGCTSSQ